jgi:hypothetical protein
MLAVLTYVILALVPIGMGVAIYVYNDTLHPLVYLMPGCGYIYVYLPFEVWDQLPVLFTDADLVLVQAFNLISILALIVGVVAGSGGVQRHPARMDRFRALAPAGWYPFIYRAGLTLAGIALLMYVYGLSNVGGFVEAYDSAKGGGKASTGYLRDFTQLCITGTALFLIARQRLGWTWRVHGPMVFVMIAPALVHGLFSGRRGPTFIGLSTLGAAWFLTQNRRPKTWQVLAGGAAVGFLLLFLVSFRGQIYIGSDLFRKGPSIAEITETVGREGSNIYGQEFVYGTYIWTAARDRDDFFWGKRYFVHTFIRPIPRFVWPNKYVDMGVKGLLVNAGTLGRDPTEAEVDRAPGAAPGFAADLYVEFWWWGVLVSGLIGWFFGLAWRKNLVEGGLWTVAYIAMIAFSLYFVTQTFVAWWVRLLVVMIPTILAWRWSRGAYRRHQAMQRRFQRARGHAVVSAARRLPNTTPGSSRSRS